MSYYDILLKYKDLPFEKIGCMKRRTALGAAAIGRRPCLNVFTKSTPQAPGPLDLSRCPRNSLPASGDSQRARRTWKLQGAAAHRGTSTGTALTTSPSQRERYAGLLSARLGQRSSLSVDMRTQFPDGRCAAPQPVLTPGRDSKASGPGSDAKLAWFGIFVFLA